MERAATASSNADFELELRGLLARLEILCLAVSSGMADEDFAFELLGSTIVWYGTACLPYFKTIRSTNVQPLLYADLQAAGLRIDVPAVTTSIGASAGTEVPPMDVAWAPQI